MPHEFLVCFSARGGHDCDPFDSNLLIVSTCITKYSQTDPQPEFMLCKKQMICNNDVMMMSTRFLHCALTSLCSNKKSFRLLYQSHAFKGITFKTLWGHPVILIHLNRKSTQTPTNLEVVMRKSPTWHHKHSVTAIIARAFPHTNMETSSAKPPPQVSSQTLQALFSIHVENGSRGPGWRRGLVGVYKVRSQWRHDFKSCQYERW